MGAIGIMLLIVVLSYLFWWMIREAVGQARASDPEMPLFESEHYSTMTESFQLEGVGGRNPDGQERMDLLRECLLGDSLSLAEEPGENDGEKNLLVCRSDGEVVGSLDPDRSAVLQESLRNGRRVEAVLSSLRGSAFLRTGLRVGIKVTREIGPSGEWDQGAGRGEAASPGGRRRGQAGPTALWV